MSDTPNQRQPQSPYPGLRPFEQNEAEIFFGRGAQIDQMLTKLEDQAEFKFLAVIGASGSGKSSLVRAGLLPAIDGGCLMNGPAKWRFITVRPGTAPMLNLARGWVKAFRPLSGEADSTATADELQRRQVDTEFTLMQFQGGPLGAVRAYRSQCPAGDVGVLLLIDQFEELFRFHRQAVDEPPVARKATAASETGTRSLLTDSVRVRSASAANDLEAACQVDRQRNEAAAFVELLLASAKQTETPIYVVLTMRSDFLGNCDAFVGLPEAISRSQFLTPRMTRDQLELAIKRPVGIAPFDATVNESLVTRILNDIGNDPDQLPLMQHALHRTWRLAVERSRKAGQREVELKMEDYVEAGQLQDSLSKDAEQTLVELSQDPLRGPARARATEVLFRALSQRTDEGQVIRRPVTFSEVLHLLRENPTAQDRADLEAVIAAFQGQGRHFLMRSVARTSDATALASPSRNASAGAAPICPGDDDTIDISHESLLRRWQTLCKRWLPAELDAATNYRRLLDGLNEQGTLLEGRRLDRALTWKTTHQPTKCWAMRYDGAKTPEESLLPACLELITRSQKAREQAMQRAIEQERQQAEAKQAMADAARFRKQAIIAVGFTVVAFIISVFAVTQRQAAKQQTNIAREQTKKAEAATNFATAQADLAEYRLKLANAESAKVKAEKEKNDVLADKALEMLAVDQLSRGVTEFHQNYSARQLQATVNMIESAPKYLGWEANLVRGTYGPLFSPRQELVAHNRGVDGIATAYGADRFVTFGSDAEGKGGGARPSLKTWRLDADGTLVQDDEILLNPNRRSLSALAMSRSGMVAAAVQTEQGRETSILLWAADQPAQERRFADIPGTVFHLAFCARDQLLAVAYRTARDDKANAATDSGMRLGFWKVENGQSDVRHSVPEEILGMVTSPDGVRLAAFDRNSVSIWDTADVTSMGVTTKLSRFVSQVTFHPTGEWLAAAHPDRFVTLIRFDDRLDGNEQLITNRAVFAGTKHRIAFDPTGQTLLSCGEQGAVAVMDMRDLPGARTLGRGFISDSDPLGQQLGMIPAWGNAVRDLFVLGQSRAVVVNVDATGSVRLFDLPRQVPSGLEFYTERPMNRMAISPDGTIVALFPTQAAFHRDDPLDRDSTSQTFDPRQSAPLDDPRAASSQDKIQFWDSRSHRWLAEIELPPQSTPPPPQPDLKPIDLSNPARRFGDGLSRTLMANPICFSADGKRLYTIQFGNTPGVFWSGLSPASNSAGDGKRHPWQPLLLKPEAGQPLRMVAAKKQAEIAIAFDSGMVVVRAESGEEHWISPAVPGCEILGIAYSPDEQSLVICGAQWKGDEAAGFLSGMRPRVDARWEPISLASFNADAATGLAVAGNVRGHHAFTVLQRGESSMLQRWDLRSERRLKPADDFQPLALPQLAPHLLLQPASAAAADTELPRTARVLGAVGGTLRVWNANNGREVVSFPYHRAPIVDLKQSATGEVVVSLDERGGVNVFETLEPPAADRCRELVNEVETLLDQHVRARSVIAAIEATDWTANEKQWALRLLRNRFPVDERNELAFQIRELERFLVRPNLPAATYRWVGKRIDLLIAADPTNERLPLAAGIVSYRTENYADAVTRLTAVRDSATNAETKTVANLVLAGAKLKHADPEVNIAGVHDWIRMKGERGSGVRLEPESIATARRELDQLVGINIAISRPEYDPKEKSLKFQVAGECRISGLVKQLSLRCQIGDQTLSPQPLTIDTTHANKFTAVFSEKIDEPKDGPLMVKAELVGTSTAKEQPVMIASASTVQFIGDKPRLFLVLCGTSELDSKAFGSAVPQLLGSINDVNNVQKAFVAGSEALYQVVPAARFVDREFTISQLEKTFSALTQQAQPGDLILFYFSGFSTIDADKSFSILTREKPLPWNEFTRMVPRNLNVVAMLDCCYAGASSVPDSTAKTGLRILASCNGTQLASDYNGDGIFSRLLVEGLAGAADENNDSVVTLRELFGFVSAKSPDTQTPQLFGDKEDDLPLTRKMEKATR